MNLRITVLNKRSQPIHYFLYYYIDIKFCKMKTDLYRQKADLELSGDVEGGEGYREN
jgi:hypothetical protein